MQMMIVKESRINLKRLLRTCAMMVLPIALFLCQINTPTSVAQTIGIESIFDIVPDTTLPTSLPSTGSLPATGTTFYIQGRVFQFRTVNQADCSFRVANPKVLGTWRAWGEVADDGRAVIKQSLTLDSVGATLEVQGTTGLPFHNGPAGPAILGTSGEPFTGPTEILSVVGGAGALRGLNGEAQIRPYCQSKDDITRPFRYDRPFCFGYVEARRR
jgi:hypothetical protein